MEEALTPSQTLLVAEQIPHVFIVTGLGGMGKTENARYFSIKNQEKFDVILFLVADQNERLSQQYTEIASRLGLVQADTSDAENARERLKTWLKDPVKNLNEFSYPRESMSGHNGASFSGSAGERAKWLLVLDNVEESRILTAFQPIMAMGSILVTSRDPSIGTPLNPSVKGVTLESLPTQEAVTLLKMISKNVKDTEENNNAAKAIVERLDGLPLAISQIGSIIASLHLSLSDFVRDYARASQYHELYDERSTTPGYEHSLGSVWAFDSLEEHDKPALLLLSVLSMLDPTCIHEEVMFKSLNNRTMPIYPHTKNDYHHTVARLIARSLVQKNVEDGSLHVHRLVQAVARARLAKQMDTFLAFFNVAWESVAERFPFRDEEMNTAGSVQRWKRCALLYPHVVQLSQVAQEIQDTRSSPELPLGFLDLLYEGAWRDSQLYML
jgi:hypothetical protein